MTEPQQKKSEASLPAVSKSKKEEIIRLLISGEYPTDSEIARKVGVGAGVVTSILASDPELRRLREEAEYEIAQRIERSAVDLACSGRNEMAKQKAQEFMLKKLMPNKYGDDRSASDSDRLPKRILLVKELPVVDVDKNGLPVATTVNPML